MLAKKAKAAPAPAWEELYDSWAAEALDLRGRAGSAPDPDQDFLLAGGGEADFVGPPYGGQRDQVAQH